MSSSFIIKKNFITYCTGTNSYQHTGNHPQEATTSTCYPTPIGRELQPHDLVYQRLPEGHSYPLGKFTSYHWKEPLTPLLKVPTLITSCGPHFRMFHTRSTFLKKSKLVGLLSSYFQIGPVTHHFVGDIPRRKKFSRMVLSWQPTAPCSHQLAHCATSSPPELAMCSLTHLP